MIKRLLKAIGLGGMAQATSCAPTAEKPYENEAVELIYEFLFCDRLNLFSENFHGEPTGFWATIFSQAPDFAALRAIAEDNSQESRVRLLAFNRLRTAKQGVPEKVLLGAIVEVHLPEGLDTLAVFADGGARYINHTGRMYIVEGDSGVFGQEIHAVLSAAQPIVDSIGRWDKQRLPPPNRGNVRMTLLASDGLYLREGTMKVIQKEQMTAPLFNAATVLLLKLVTYTPDS